MRGLLLDLDGVFYVGDDPVPGAVETAQWLRRGQVPHLYVTNTTSRPRAAVAATLARLGIPAEAEQILTPCVAAVEWLRSQGRTRPALFVPDRTVDDFTADSTGLQPHTRHQLAATRDLEAVDAVVVGDLGVDWDFATLNLAFRLLMGENGPPLVALGMTRYWHALDGLRLDTGAFVAALSAASGREPVVLGKPAAHFFDAALARLGVAADAAAMVGDDVRTDVHGAQDAGLTGVLVRTGKFRPDDLRHARAPDAVLDSVGDLPDWWAGRLG